MRVTETAHWLEWQDWADPIVAEPFLERRNSRVIVPNRPGNGLASERGRGQAISATTSEGAERHRWVEGRSGCFTAATGRSRRHTPNELRTAIRKAVPIRHLRSISDQFVRHRQERGEHGAEEHGQRRGRWRGRAPGTRGSAITILATIAPCTGSSCRSSYGPDGRSGRAISRPLPRSTFAAIAAVRPTGPHVHLMPIELVGNVPPLLDRVSQRVPVVTESVFPGNCSCHRYSRYSKRGTRPSSTL